MKPAKRRLRRGLFVLVFLIPLSSVCSSISFGSSRNSPEVSQSVQNIEIFARLYGYVRYFYPGDEAAATDWERLAIYGVKQVRAARDTAELKKVLEDIFLPVAPALIIHETGDKVNFSVEAITPPEPGGKKVVCWQHLGVGFGSAASAYKSIRLNRNNILSSDSAFDSITQCLDAAPYRGKPIKLRAAVKVAAGRGQLWLRVDRQSGNTGFFDNMNDRPVTSRQWNYYDIVGTVDADAQTICCGCMLLGLGNMWTDDFQLFVKDDVRSESWKPVVVANPGFEEDEAGFKPAKWGGMRAYGYSFQVTSETAAQGRMSVHVQNHGIILSAELFPQKPTFGSVVAKELGAGLSCLMPIALYGTEAQTFPPSQQDRLERLKVAMNKALPGPFSGDDQDVRLADIVISWNIFQHFFPYFDVVKTDWQAALPEALAEALNDKDQMDFLKTLKRFTAKLKDGHARAMLRSDTSDLFSLPLSWDWVENRLVVTKVLDAALTRIRPGDVVTKINGAPAKDALKDEEQYVSAATPGWKRYRSLAALIAGSKDQEFRLEIVRDGKTNQETLRASLSIQEYYELSKKDAIKSRKLEEGIYYLNLDQIPMDDIDRMMPELEKAKAIICDLRGYPNSNHKLICHLLKENETAQWMWIPQIIYPDREQVSYQKVGWYLEPLKPTLSAKMVFITDGRAISYAESFLGYIEGYKLATIVGQPTAGTNGNINPFMLPGGYSVTWTGMKVLKLDGSPHHGVGIIPNVAAERTIKGIKEGRDEFLEKALEVAKK